MKPAESGLLKNCEEEVSFVCGLKEVIKILKLIFCDKFTEDLKFSSKTTEEFVNNKR